MALVTKNLWAKAGSLSLPGRTAPFWGFAGSAGAVPQIPGPLIQTTALDTLRIRLANNLGEPASIIFPGQENVMARKLPGGTLRPVRPQYSDGKMISLTDYLDANTSDRIEYRFSTSKPGIYLYESGTNPEKQIQMGLYGVILVRPPGYNIPGHPNYKTAYGAGTDSRYNVEKIIIAGEIDSTMHDNVFPNVYYDMLKFKPHYWMINGRSFPDTLNNDDSSSQPYGSLINCRTGERVLLRIVNAGFQNHTIYFGGLTGRVVAEDSFPLRSPLMDATYEKTGVTTGSGQSFDVLIIPEAQGEFYIYDREYHHLVNNNQFPGGMMTKIIVSP